VFHPFATRSDRILVFAAALVLLVAAPAILRWWRTERQARGATTNAARAALPVALALCLGVLAFQLAAPSLRTAIEQAYDGDGSSWLAQRWRMGHGRPVEAYLWQAFDAARVLATSLLFCAAAWLAWAARRAWSPRPRLFGVLSVWLLLHLALFLAVQRYHAWNACMPAIPFCGLLGLAFAQTWRSARPVAIVLGAAILWLLAYSPLIRGLAVWNKSGEFNTHLMAQLERVAAEVPAGSRLEFEAFPNLNISLQREGPEPSSAFTLNEASLKAWMKMCQPDKNLVVDVRSTAALRGSVNTLQLQWSRNDSGAIVVRPRAQDQ
jgi:hypothetical protein